jgi:gliding motility-associated-like protein
MELLLLKSSVCLLALLLFYKVALEPLSIHKFKRVYLLVAVVVAAIIPFITFVKYVDPTFDNSSFIFDTSATIPLDTNFKIVEETNYLSIILWSIYALGVSLFFIRFCANLFKIVSKIRKHTKVKSQSFINVLMEHLEIPHTFFKYIFLNKNKFENNQIPPEVLLHEQTHAKQKHSLDIIIIELLQVVFWFNPLVYWLKKEVKLNHEFLADQHVINQGVNTTTYQTILLQFSSNQQELALANAINYSSIKKRFTLMKTQTPKSIVWLRSLLMLPLLGLLIYSFSDTIEVEKETNTTIIRKFKNAPDKVKSEINYINNKDKYYKNVTIIFRDKNKNIITAKKYVDLSEIEKKLLPPPPPKPIKINPTKQQLNNWLDSKKYGIWLDGKKIDNNKISSISSFVHYFESKLAKNALNYGNHYYQVNLYTEKGFNKTWENAIKPLSKDSEIFIYYNKKALSNNKNQISKYTHSATFLEDTKLIVNGIECDGCTLNLSKKGIAELILSTTNQEDITNFKLKIPGVKTLLNEGNTPSNDTRQYISRIKKGDLIMLFDIASKSKKYKSIRIQLVDSDDENYSESPKVKKGEESSIPPPPPPPPANPNATPEEKAKQEKVVSEYYKNNKVVNGKVLRNPPPPPPPANPNATPEEKAKQEKVVSDYYKNNKIVNGKVLRNPPPPPPPASTSEHIAEMAKKNATYFHNGNPITAEEAKQVIKNNKQVNISSHTNNGVSTVLLSNKPIETINGKQVKSNSNDCLSFNNTINFKQSNTTLKINCIENYPNNELKIFNRWGKMIYSKKGYNNSWNGKVDQEFTDNEDGSVTQGTYYYVLKTGTKEEPTAGPLYIIN